MRTAESRAIGQLEDRVVLGKIRLAFEHEIAAGRGYLVARSGDFQTRAEGARREFLDSIGNLRRTISSDRMNTFINGIVTQEQVHHDAPKNFAREIRSTVRKTAPGNTVDFSHTCPRVRAP